MKRLPGSTRLGATILSFTPIRSAIIAAAFGLWTLPFRGILFENNRPEYDSCTVAIRNDVDRALSLETTTPHYLPAMPTRPDAAYSQSFLAFYPTHLSSYDTSAVASVRIDDRAAAVAAAIPFTAPGRVTTIEVTQK